MPIAVVIGESQSLPPTLSASVVSKGRGAPMRVRGLVMSLAGRTTAGAWRHHSIPRSTPQLSKSTLTILPKVLETESAQD